MPNLQNLRPWKPGVSGNPGGRPKRDLSAEVARAVFEKNAELIYRAMLRALKKGDARTFAILADRAYGKVTNKVELTDQSDIVERLQAARKRSQVRPE